MISTPSYPASRASTAQRTNPSISRATPRADSALGRNGVIGDFTADADTENGW